MAGFTDCIPPLGGMLLPKNEARRLKKELADE
jgi:hypothetical protein